MKKQIAKRLNIALDATDWGIMQRYMEINRFDQTEAIRGLLRAWERDAAPIWEERMRKQGWWEKDGSWANSTIVLYPGTVERLQRNNLTPDEAFDLTELSAVAGSGREEGNQ